jgi:hypothetical protein
MKQVIIIDNGEGNGISVTLSLKTYYIGHCKDLDITREKQAPHTAWEISLNRKTGNGTIKRIYPKKKA